MTDTIILGAKVTLKSLGGLILIGALQQGLVNVYNHQKVMAAHELARDLIHLIIREGMDINGKRYDDPSLFLPLFTA